VQLQAGPISEAVEWLDARRRRLEERYARLDDLLSAMDDTPRPEQKETS